MFSHAQVFEVDAMGHIEDELQQVLLQVRGSAAGMEKEAYHLGASSSLA